MKTRMAAPLVIAFAALLGCGSAAATTTWTMTGSSSQSGTAGNTRSFTGTGEAGTVSASAWSNTKTGGYLDNAYLGLYSGGLGVTNKIEPTGSPDHSTDNSGQGDSILLDFGVGKSLQLQTLTIGWWNTDSDVFVLAYTGSGVPSFTTLSNNVSYGTLLTSGWSVVRSSGSSNYMNAANGGNGSNSYKSLAVNDLNVSARYWLIGALNTAINPKGETYDGNLDYVKLVGLSGQYTKVPEPASLALALGALAGGFWLRRRKA